MPSVEMQRRTMWFGVVAGLVSLAALAGPRADVVEGPRATPAPRGLTAPDASNRGDVIAYARMLDFDTASDAGDTRRLSTPSCVTCAFGPLATIQPERGTVTLTQAELASGRIIARIVSRDAEAWSDFALTPRDTTYLWVDSLAGAWRMIFVPNRKDAEMVVRPMTIRYHPETEHDRAEARWRYSSRTGAVVPWERCAKMGCCEPH